MKNISTKKKSIVFDDRKNVGVCQGTMCRLSVLVGFMYVCVRVVLYTAVVRIVYWLSRKTTKHATKNALKGACVVSNHGFTSKQQCEFADHELSVGFFGNYGNSLNAGQQYQTCWFAVLGFMWVWSALSGLPGSYDILLLVGAALGLIRISVSMTNGR